MGRNGPDNDLRPGEEQHEGHPIQREYAMKASSMLSTCTKAG